MDAYERLLSDAMAGDGTLFAGQDGVEAAWAVVQPVMGSVVPVYEYEPGTWGPSEAEQFVSRPAEAGNDGAPRSASLPWAYRLASAKNVDEKEGMLNGKT